MRCAREPGWIAHLDWRVQVLRMCGAAMPSLCVFLPRNLTSVKIRCRSFCDIHGLYTCMRYVKRDLLLFIAGLVTACASCKKEDADLPGWFPKNARYYYDLATDTSYKADYRLLGVARGRSSDELIFEERPGDTALRIWSQVFGPFGNGVLKMRPDGLYASASTSCGMSLVSNSFEFLSVPSEPAAGSRIQLYGCARRDAGFNEIPITDTLITVPAGRFQTFCVRHPSGDRSFWHRETGIIMYEIWSHDGAFPIVKLGTLKLSRIR